VKLLFMQSSPVSHRFLLLKSLAPSSQTRSIYDGISKSFRTGRLERELQMVQLSATRCNSIAILWLSLVSFAPITLCVAYKQVFIVVSVYFVIDSVRKLLDISRMFFLW
jgi:hypothetical protein